MDISTVGGADENNNLQQEEIEALGAIYNDDFTLEEESPPTFSISIRLNDDSEIPRKEIKECSLTISFPSEYPYSAPPIYQLSIPWLRGQEKQNICLALEELYLTHIGESVVYVWVEKIREILQNQSDHYGISVNNQEPHENVQILSVPCDNNLNDQKTNCDEAFDMSPQGHRNEDLPSPKVFITTGEPFTDRKSTFQGHVALIADPSHVKLVLCELYKNKKIATATHNMYAYRIFKENSQNWLQDCDDDGETHAGSRLLHLLQILDCKNVIVVVTRWYGGIQLHGDRFKHINNVARQLLDAQGFVHKSLNSTKK